MPEGFGYENIFRIAIVEFMDHHNFCIGRVKRSCIHFVTPAGQIIPFETYNMFYRDDAARQRLLIGTQLHDPLLDGLSAGLAHRGIACRAAGRLPEWPSLFASAQNDCRQQQGGKQTERRHCHGIIPASVAR